MTHLNQSQLDWLEQLEVDEKFMKISLDEAKLAYDEGEVPIGAVLVKNNEILGRTHNTREISLNPLHHAEMLLLEQAGALLKNWRLIKTTIYVTVEPCPMCLGSILQARVERLVFGCTDPKRRLSNNNRQNNLHNLSPDEFSFPSLFGFNSLSGNNHIVEVRGGVLQQGCSAILTNFFAKSRDKFYF